MQRALSFAHNVRALQKARNWSPEVAQAVLQWRNRRTGPNDHHVSPSAGRGQGAVSSARELVPVAAQEPGFHPELPICEREARHAVPLSDLLAWRDAAQRQVEAVGDSWAQQDEGPSAEDLQTELSWLLDDSLAAWARPGGAWRSISWRRLEQDLQQRQELQDAACQYLVHLREPLEVLEEVWERRLVQRVPLQYLTATAFWRDIVLSVGPGVLIPRPETELIIDFVQEAVAAAPDLANGVWADLGTGSGALAVGVARSLPQAKVYAVDLSRVPLAFAAFNARRLGVAEQVSPIQGSWFEPLEAAGVQQLAGVVSNPPYIRSTDMPGLQAEVGRHEPHLALDGGEGLGIDSLLPICTGSARHLQPGGFLALETAGGEQAHYIADLLSHMRCSALGLQSSTGSKGSIGSVVGAVSSDEQLAFVDVRVRKDLRGVDRFVTASRTAGPPPSLC